MKLRKTLKEKKHTHRARESMFSTQTYMFRELTGQGAKLSV